MIKSPFTYQPATRITLEQLASAECIQRSNQREVAKMRTLLAEVHLDTVVDGGDGPQTMAELAHEHLKASKMDGAQMSAAQAWCFALSDLVFNGYQLVKEVA